MAQRRPDASDEHTSKTDAGRVDVDIDYTRPPRRRRKGETPRAVTMQDVARFAGVSVTTVSFVLNERPDTGLREETQQRVRAAIRELDYRPNKQARALARSSTQTIGFVAERLGSPYSGRIISGAHDQSRAHDSVLLILDAEDQNEVRECVEELLDRRVDALILAAEGTASLRAITGFGTVPTVLVNCMMSGSVPSLLPDENAGGRAAARMLIDAGHRDVAYLAGDPAAWATRQRVKGFRAAFAEVGVTGRALPVEFGDYRAESGFELTLEVMRRRRRPTGLFLGNDRMAMGAYYALTELGLRVPDDVSVVGYDDQEELASSMRPALSTIRLPFYEMGQAAARHIFDRTAALLPRRTSMYCAPVPRSSIGRPRPAGLTADPEPPSPASRRASDR